MAKILLKYLWIRVKDYFDIYSIVKVGKMPGRKVGVILCGGNLDMDKLPWTIV